MRISLIAALVSASCAALFTPLSQAADTSLDDLQRQIDAAKAAKPKAGKKSTAASEQSATRTGKLILESDRSCRLNINGESKGSLEAGSAKVVSVPVGEQLVECIPAQGGKARQVVDVEANKQQVVTLAFARFTNADGGVLDSKTGLLWAADDNGGDIDWRDATQHCRSRGGSWRLPSRSELMSIYDSGSQQCGGDKCKVDKAIHLTNSWFWSNEQNGSSEAWFVALTHGGQRSHPLDIRPDLRALCVRRP